MAALTPEMRAKYGRMCDWLPEHLVAQIDQDELLDRLDDAAELNGKADRAPSPTLAAGYMQRARAILTAQPRDETEARVQRLLTRADQAHTNELSAMLRDQARAVKADNPTAARRPRVHQPTEAERGRAEALAAWKTEIEDMVKAALEPTNRPLEKLDTLRDSVNQLNADIELLKARRAQKPVRGAAQTTRPNPDAKTAQVPPTWTTSDRRHR